MALVYLALLVVALVSLGTFAAKHNEIRTESVYALAPEQLGQVTRLAGILGGRAVMFATATCSTIDNRAYSQYQL